MKTNVVFLAVALALAALVWSCSDEPAAPTSSTQGFDEEYMALFGVYDGDDSSDVCVNPNFGAILRGRNEVPPRTTKGHGVAKFRVNPAHDTLFFHLNASNIRNVVGAHVHLGVYGENGPVVAGLYSAPPGGGRQNGLLARGILTPADLVGPLAGGANFDLFLSNLYHDSLYVNVHTNDGVDPPNSGPGDYPGGEIRGQLKHAPTSGGIGKDPR